MLAFGIVGLVLREMRFPMAPLVLGLVLGPILDTSLRRGLVLSDGSLEPFFTRPISLVLWLAILITVLLSFAPVQRAAARLLGRRRPAAEEAGP
jgi:putative tricarboxylic transport membrane protein